MPWIGATYSTSYQEIMSHLFEHCNFVGDRLDPECVRRTQERIEEDARSRQEKMRTMSQFPGLTQMLSQMLKGEGTINPYTGQYIPRNEAERIALDNWIRLKNQRPTQTQVLIGGFETQPDLYAMQTRGRVNVHYGDAMSTSQDVKVEGPHGISREFHTDDPREAALIRGAANKLFTGNEDMEQTRKLMEYLRQMLELYRLGR